MLKQFLVTLRIYCSFVASSALRGQSGQSRGHWKRVTSDVTYVPKAGK